MAAMTDFFSIATLNCRGSRDPGKVNIVNQAIKDFQIVCLQETHFRNPRESSHFDGVLGQNFRIYKTFTEPTNSFTGVNLLIRRDSPVTQIVHRFDIRGRAVAVTAVIGHLSFFVVGIYAPANERERPAFYTDLMAKIDEIDWYNYNSVIVLGDFNMVEDRILDRETQAQNVDRQIGLQEWLLLKEFLNIHDMFREKYPQKDDFFTCLSTRNSRSRLDRVYSSINLCENFMCTTRSVNLTDHKVFRVKLNLKLAMCQRGPGFFKLNTLLLNENGVENFVFSKLRHISENMDISVFLWENFKKEIRNYFQNLGKKKAKERNLRRNRIEESLRRTEDLIVRLPNQIDKDRLKEDVKHWKRELESINNFYLSSCRHNTYFKDFVDDKITFSTAKSLQKKDWEQRHIYSIKRTDGSLATEPNDMLEVVKSQYESVFTSEQICQRTLTSFLQQANFPRLSEDQKDQSENLFTQKEIKDAIHALQGNKTPGFDSIPIEFYWKFSDQISFILCNIFNNFRDVGYMYPSAYTGVISLLYKGSGERNVRENWRPLTLLNVDYKIYAKAIAVRRLEKVMTTDNLGSS